MDNATYREGDAFAVPLDDGGYGIGVVARAHNTLVLGYFFDPVHTALPELRDLDLDRDEAVEVEIFGDDGLADGGWPILGQLHGWDRDAWPMPWFVNLHHAGQKFRQLSSFYPDDPGKGLGYRRVTPAEAEGLPRAGFSPRRAQEIGLNRLLHREPRPLPRVRILPGPAKPARANPDAEEVAAPEEAVRVYFRLQSGQTIARTEAHLEAFEDALDDRLRTRKVGYVDGNERGDGEFVLFLYGPDRRRLWAETEKMLKWAPVPATSAYLREADLDAEPTIITL